MWPFIKKVYSEFWTDRIPAVSAGITFFFLLAIFPAIASVVSLYGMVADRSSIADVTSLASTFLPGGAISVLSGELHRLVALPPERLNFAFVAGLIVAVWSASGGISALIDGLDIAYEVTETRSYLTLTIHALLFTVIAIVFGVVAVNLAVVLPKLLTPLTGRAGGLLVLRAVSLPLLFLAALAMISLIYRFGPDRKTPWTLWSWGGMTAAFLWIVATLLFSWYVQNFGSYDRVYGNLGAAVGFLTWVWISLVILLLGAEINCEVERAPKPGSLRRFQTVRNFSAPAVFPARPGTSSSWRSSVKPPRSSR